MARKENNNPILLCYAESGQCYDGAEESARHYPITLASMQVKDMPQLASTLSSIALKQNDKYCVSLFIF